MVSLEIYNRIAFITLNRVEKKNALNDEMVVALCSAFTKSYADDLCKIIVLQANGDVFSAGADLGYLKQLQQNTFEQNLEDSSDLAALFKLIYTGPKMVVASIQGHAIAGGCGLATVCDYSFASVGAKFGYTEVKIGFVPAIVSYFLLRKIGEGATKDLLLTGRLIPAMEAQQLGLINKVVNENLNEHVLAFCNTIIENCSAMSLLQTKALIANMYHLNVDKAMQFAAETNATARASADCKTGIAAFLEKKALKW